MNRRTARIVLVLLILSIVFAALKVSWARYAAIEEAKIRKQMIAAQEQQSKRQLGSAGQTADSSILLNGEYECRQASTSAIISRGRAVVTYVPTQSSKTATATARMIFDGDCLYSWTDGTSQGATKRCGMSEYLGVYSTFSSFLGGGEGPDVRSLFSLLQGKNIVDTQTEAKIASLMDSCQSGRGASDSAFLVPTSVRFEDVK
jgi:hypothetical protein